jgi:hypothetical protein
MNLLTRMSFWCWVALLAMQIVVMFSVALLLFVVARPLAYAFLASGRCREHAPRAQQSVEAR